MAMLRPRCTRQSTRQLAALLLATLAWLASSRPAQAGGPIVNSFGFESSAGYSTTYLPPGGYAGQLKGQQDWVTAGGGGGTATVQSTVVADGGQALQVQRGANSNDYWAVQVDNFPTGRFVHISWDQRIVQNSTAGFGPFLGVEPYDFSSSGLQYLARLGVEVTNGEVVYARGADKVAPGAFEYSGMQVAFNAWHHFDLVLDYNSKRYRGFVNGSMVVDEMFIDAAGTQLTDADIVALATNGDTSSAMKTANGYFDNFLVTDGILGDFDEDGDVDDADLANWEAAFGAGGGADATGDGLTTGADFLVWQRAKGVDFFPAVPVGSPVPEPAAVPLAAVALAALLSRRRP